MKKKFFSGLAFCCLLRLFRFFPNNDPIMGFALPIARQGKWWHALLFPMASMVLFDVVTMRLGLWTIGTASLYGLIGFSFYKYFKKKKTVSLKTYVGSSAIGVLVFDFLTGPIMSSYLFRIPFSVALTGQVPFTLFHLASAMSFTLLLAPVLDPCIAKSVNAEFTKNVSRLKLLIEAPKKAVLG